MTSPVHSQVSAFPTWWKSSSTLKFILYVLSFTQERGVIYLLKTSLVEINLMFYHLSATPWERQFIWSLIFFFSPVKIMPWTWGIVRPLSVPNQGFPYFIFNLRPFYPSRIFPFIQPIYIEYKWGIGYFLSRNLLSAWCFSP